MASAAEPDLKPGPLARLLHRLRQWRDGRIADPAFQAWATAFPLTRPIANRQGAALYDLVAGFVYSQVLFAAVEIDLFNRLRDGPHRVERLAHACGLPVEGMARLLQAAQALNLVSRRGEGWAIGPLGSALLGAPGVTDMVRHHRLFYADLADPLKLLRANPGETELSRFWAYVHGTTTHDMPQGTAGPYSRLMATSQAMVAAETLAVHPMTGVRRLMDVGGGEGAFLGAALTATPALRGTVFDLPAVADRARRHLAGFGDRAEIVGGSFLSDPLPDGADAISLVRVLYDHDDAVVAEVLARVFAALPPGGRLIVSEPMSGGRAPTRPGDVYFNFYTAAMTSGKPRSVVEHSANLRAAGFRDVTALRPRQPFITRVITARKA